MTSVTPLPPQHPVFRPLSAVCAVSHAGLARCPPVRFAAATPTSSSTSWPPPRTANISHVGCRDRHGAMSCTQEGAGLACCKRAPPNGESPATTACVRRATLRPSPPSGLGGKMVDVKAHVRFSISAELGGTDVAIRPSPRRHLNMASGQKLAHVLAARYDLFYFTRSRKLQLHAVEVI